MSNAFKSLLPWIGISLFLLAIYFTQQFWGALDCGDASVRIPIYYSVSHFKDQDGVKKVVAESSELTVELISKDNALNYPNDRFRAILDAALEAKSGSDIELQSRITSIAGLPCIVQDVTAPYDSRVVTWVQDNRMFSLIFGFAKDDQRFSSIVDGIAKSFKANIHDVSTERRIMHVGIATITVPPHLSGEPTKNQQNGMELTMCGQQTVLYLSSFPSPFDDGVSDAVFNPLFENFRKIGFSNLKSGTATISGIPCRVLTGTDPNGDYSIYYVFAKNHKAVVLGFGSVIPVEDNPQIILMLSSLQMDFDKLNVPNL